MKLSSKLLIAMLSSLMLTVLSVAHAQDAVVVDGDDDTDDVTEISDRRTLGPQELMIEGTEKVLDMITNNRDKWEADPEYRKQQIDALFLPSMDFRAMSKLVLGGNWRQMNKAQRERFVEGFKSLLVRTYAKSLSQYSDEEIRYLPFRPGRDPEKRAMVRSEIIRASGPAIPVNYRLRYKPQDGWKIYDLDIEGISLVANYRTSMRRNIASKGIEKVLTSLEERASAGDDELDDDLDGGFQEEIKKKAQAKEAA